MRRTNDRTVQSSRVMQLLRLTLVVLGALALAGCTVAAQSPNLGSSIGPKVAGTYFLDVRHDGYPPAAALVTITSDGGFFSTDVSDHGAGGLSTTDSPGQGTWKAIDQQTLIATSMYFGFDTSGIPQWIGKAKGQFVFSADYKSGTGALKIERFRLNQDPLDPNEIPHDVLNATVTARRVPVD